MLVKTCTYPGCKSTHIYKAANRQHGVLCLQHWHKWCAENGQIKPIKIPDNIEFGVPPIKKSLQVEKPKPIKPVSEKQAKRLAEYRKVRDEHFKENPTCQYPGCESKRIDLHHAAGRTGKLLTDKTYFRSLCREHHIWAEKFPRKAKELNLSFNRL